MIHSTAATGSCAINTRIHITNFIFLRDFNVNGRKCTDVMILSKSHANQHVKDGLRDESGEVHGCTYGYSAKLVLVSLQWWADT